MKIRQSLLALTALAVLGTVVSYFLTYQRLIDLANISSLDDDTGPMIWDVAEIIVASPITVIAAGFTAVVAAIMVAVQAVDELRTALVLADKPHT